MVLYSRSLFTTAGLLTFPDLASFPPQCIGAVEKDMTNSFNGITAAGTVPDFHRIPF